MGKKWIRREKREDSVRVKNELNEQDGLSAHNSKSVLDSRLLHQEAVGWYYGDTGQRLQGRYVAETGEARGLLRRFGAFTNTRVQCVRLCGRKIFL